MNSFGIEEVKTLLRKQNYLVKVCETFTGCRVIFPEPKLLKKHKQEIIIYDIINSEPSGLKVWNNETSEFWGAPEYSLRLMITCDISRRMKKFSIHDSLVDYYNKDEMPVDTLASILPGPTDPEEKKKEGFLAVLIVNAIQDNFKPEYEDVANSPEHNVGTGYRLLRSFF